MTDIASPTVTSNFKRLFYRPPFVGLLAFVIVFLMQGLGHTQMVLMESLFGKEYVYQSAAFLGFLGVVFLFIGMRRKGEVSATWLGFFAGTCLWTGWVEFTYVWSARVLGVPDLMDQHAAGEIATKAEYLVMMSSAGVLLATMAPLLLNRETKCNMFAWFQRRLHLRTGKPSRGYERNFAYVTCLETIYVIWFCYLALLFIYDENILGDRHPVTYGIFVAGSIWSIYLMQRLARMWKVTTAIRYAIPTAIIAYSCYEIAGRWNLFADIWVHPERYWLQLSLIFAALVLIVVVAVFAPQHLKAILDREGRLHKT
ncbi:MAG: hypothetical protein R3F24_09435 [Gammaproteobacteria bacterium]